MRCASGPAAPRSANLYWWTFPQEREAEVDKGQILYGMDLGAPSAEPGDEDGETKEGDTGTRSVPLGSRVFYTAEEVRAFRTFGLEPGECEAERAAVESGIHLGHMV